MIERKRCYDHLISKTIKTSVQFYFSFKVLPLSTITLDEENNGYVARYQLLYALIVKSWTHARSTRSGISAKSSGNKNQSALSYRLVHYRETRYPPSAGDAQSTKFGLLAAIS